MDRTSDGKKDRTMLSNIIESLDNFIPASSDKLSESEEFITRVSKIIDEHPVLGNMEVPFVNLTNLPNALAFHVILTMNIDPEDVLIFSCNGNNFNVSVENPDRYFGTGKCLEGCTYTKELEKKVKDLKEKKKINKSGPSDLEVQSMIKRMRETIEQACELIHFDFDEPDHCDYPESGEFKPCDYFDDPANFPIIESDDVIPLFENHTDLPDDYVIDFLLTTGIDPATISSVNMIDEELNIVNLTLCNPPQEISLDISISAGDDEADIIVEGEDDETSQMQQD